MAKGMLREIFTEIKVEVESSGWVEVGRGSENNIA